MVETGWSSGAFASDALVAIMLLGMVSLLLWSKNRLDRQRNLLAILARRRRERLAEALRLFRMAEQIADLGIWQYYPDENRQDWSDGLKRLFGIEPDEVLLAGDIETLLAANGVDPADLLMDSAGTRDQIDLDFSIHRLDGKKRELALCACHLRDRSGAVSRIVAVVMDVTNQRRREQRLRRSRELAVREARRARTLAETDVLTGLANRRRVMVKLDRMTMNARKKMEPLSIVVFDVDHFKKVNDNYGHQAGDEVLQKIATIVRKQVRKGDIVGRIGGEEFVWILPGADIEAAQLVADRLRLAISLESGTDTVPAVTVSLGLASATDADTSLSLFSRADQALYGAKDGGRNLVRLAA